MSSPLAMNNGLLFPLTPHAQQRIAERGLSLPDLAMALLFGATEKSKPDRFRKVLGAKQLRTSPFLRRMRHLMGLTIVVANDGHIITAYIDSKRRRASKRRVCKRKQTSEK